jgi:hypothetical protein
MLKQKCMVLSISSLLKMRAEPSFERRVFQKYLGLCSTTYWYQWSINGPCVALEYNDVTLLSGWSRFSFQLLSRPTWLADQNFLLWSKRAGYGFATHVHFNAELCGYASSFLLTSGRELSSLTTPSHELHFFCHHVNVKADSLKKCFMHSFIVSGTCFVERTGFSGPFSQTAFLQGNARDLWHTLSVTVREVSLTLWRRSSSKCYLRIQSVPQREHHTSPLQRSTG